MFTQIFYVLAQLALTLGNLYFMRYNRKAGNHGMANFSAFAAGITFIALVLALADMAGLPA